MRTLWWIVGLVIVGAGIWLAWEIRAEGRMRVSTESYVKVQRETASDLRTRTKVQTARADAAEREIARLQAVPEPAPAPAPTAVPADFQEQLAEIARMSAAGKYDEALAGYLKLYAQIKGLKERERVALAVCVLAMTKGFEPALKAAHEMREQAWRDLRANPGHPFLPGEIALISLRLEEPAEMLPVWDFLPNGDSRKGNVRPYIQPSLVVARRYAEAVEVQPFARLFGALESGFTALGSAPAPTVAERKKKVIEDTARGIEALTGAGKEEEARLLTERLLALDAGESTRQVIQEHLRRAKE